MTNKRSTLVGLLTAFAVLAALCGTAVGAATMATSGGATPAAHEPSRTIEQQEKQAAGITTAQANAMQARVVSLGEANSILSNPYIEQKVTTPESTGKAATRIPAGGF